MTQTSTAARQEMRADAPRASRPNVRFGIAVGLVLIAYATFATGSMGAGFEAVSDAGVERTGPFRSVLVVLEPSRLVVGAAIGIALAVIACAALLRDKPQVAAAVRTLALTAIVLLVIAAWAAAWLWQASFEPGQAHDLLRNGDVAIPWPLDVSVHIEPW